jgi:hypothetical protein
VLLSTVVLWAFGVIEDINVGILHCILSGSSEANF